MKKSRLFALLLALAMVLSLFAGCGQEDPAPTPTPDSPAPTPSDPTPTEPTKTEKVYRTYLSKDTAMLNSHDDANAEVGTPYKWCNSNLYRMIPNENGNNFEYLPDLAATLPELVKTEENVTYTKYETEKQEDGSSKFIPVEAVATLSTYEIQIRDDAVWHNGEKLTAEDIVYSQKMLLDPTLLNQMASSLYDSAITLYNGQKYYLGDCEWEDVGIKVTEDGNGILVTVIGSPDAATICSAFRDDNRVDFPVYEEYYEAGMNADRTETTYGKDLSSFMGCGPYYLDTWEQGNKHIYKKNPDHWLADLYNYDVVEVYIIDEENAAVQMFEAGKLDMLTPDKDTIETYIEDPRLVSSTSFRMYHIDVNDGSLPTRNPVADTVAWRKAVYHSLDRETIAKEFFGNMEPAGWFINGEAGLLSESGLTFRESEYGKKIEQMVADWSAEGHTTGYNPELARKYLAEAYAEKGLDPNTEIEVGWLFAPGSEWEALGQWLADQYEIIFEGKVHMYMTPVPSGMSDSAAIATFEWDMYHNTWARAKSRYLPYEAFYYFTSSYASPPNVYRSQRFDEKYVHCKEFAEADWDTILKESYEIEMIYLEDVVNVPVIQTVSYTLFSERLQLPIDTYIPGFGWGEQYGDIVE